MFKCIKTRNTIKILRKMNKLCAKSVKTNVGYPQSMKSSFSFSGEKLT